MATPQQQLKERVVLVVDDEDIVRQCLTRILTYQGFRVLEARDGMEAETLLETLGPTVVGLVVSDIMMPLMTGNELAAVMADRWPTVPILLVSGQGRPVGDYGGQFLAKPFTPDALMASVSELLPFAEKPCGSSRG
jgi:DNA-binding response OmpR family regulator